MRDLTNNKSKQRSLHHFWPLDETRRKTMGGSSGSEKPLAVRSSTGSFNLARKRPFLNDDDDQENVFPADSAQFNFHHQNRKKIKEEEEVEVPMGSNSFFSEDGEPREGDVPERKPSPANLPVGAGNNGAESPVDSKRELKSVIPKISRRSLEDGDMNIDAENESLAEKEPSTDDDRRKSRRTLPKVDYVDQMYLDATKVKLDGKRSRGRPPKAKKEEKIEEKEVDVENEKSDIHFSTFEDKNGKLHMATYDLSIGRVGKEYVTVIEKIHYEQVKERFLYKPRKKGGNDEEKENEEPEEEVEEEEEEAEADYEGTEPSEDSPDDETYEVERIVGKIRNPRHEKDKVFIVLWRDWNPSACTLSSLYDLRGSPDMLNLYANYEDAAYRIVRSYCNRKNAPRAHKLIPLLISKMHDRWLTDVEWEREKRKRDFTKNYGLWPWIEMSRKWNEVDRKSRPEGEHFPLYLECFHENAKLPAKFEYISKNTVSPFAQEIIDSIVLKTPEGCSCTCQGPCEPCQEEMNQHEPCRLKGNGIEVFHREGYKSRSFETLICKGACSRTDGHNCALPRRQRPLLIAYRPKVEGVGVYATEAIPRFNILCEYTGEMISIEEANGRKTNYQFAVPGVDVVIDAIHKGNEARFINHSCAPNCGLLVLHEGNLKAVPRLYVVTLKDIKQGGELLLDYHPSCATDTTAERPQFASKCYCGARKCRKFV